MDPLGIWRLQLEIIRLSNWALKSGGSEAGIVEKNVGFGTRQNWIEC